MAWETEWETRGGDSQPGAKPIHGGHLRVKGGKWEDEEGGDVDAVAQ